MITCGVGVTFPLLSSVTRQLLYKSPKCGKQITFLTMAAATELDIAADSSFSPTVTCDMFQRVQLLLTDLVDGVDDDKFLHDDETGLYHLSSGMHCEWNKDLACVQLNWWVLPDCDSYHRYNVQVPYPALPADLCKDLYVQWKQSKN